MEADCIFCKIVAREVPAEIIAETDKTLVIKDIAPKAKIHYLIIPKEHYRDLQGLEDCCLGVRMLHMAQQLSVQNPEAKDYKLVINNGYNAGQRVFHLHMHFLAGQFTGEIV
jgi:histidine triad (HIT) family protein